MICLSYSFLRMVNAKCLLLIFATFFVCSSKSFAQDKQQPASQKLSIAVASNFKPTLEKLVAAFAKENNIPTKNISLSSASTGVLYNQILNGAPFDLFFSADWQRPDKLIKKGIGHKRRSAVYAVGKLVLWYPGFSGEIGEISEKGENDLETLKLALLQLKSNPDSKLALANPELAPFGKAALQVLQRTSSLEELSANLVKGNNVAHAFQFVQSKAAQAGMISASQIALSPVVIEVPEELYSPIKQQMVVINSTSLAMKFYRFVLSRKGREIIAKNSYALPSSADVKLML